MTQLSGSYRPFGGTGSSELSLYPVPDYSTDNLSDPILRNVRMLDLAPLRHELLTAFSQLSAKESVIPAGRKMC